MATSCCLQNASAQKDDFDGGAIRPAAAGDEARPPPPPPPKYFLKPAGVTNRAGCKSAAESGSVTPVTGKIFTRPNDVRL